MTTYQAIIRAHLTAILAKGNAVTIDIVVQTKERDFVRDLCLEFGYIPTFSISMQGYTTMNAIKIFVC